MFTSALSPEGQSVLELLSRKVIGNTYYLAGGTAVALQLGHRISEDLDFFTGEPFATTVLKLRIQEAGVFELPDERWGTLHGIFNGIKVSFLYYKYPLLFPPVSFLGASVAQIKDLAPMKIEAIASRGSRKDFYDLYFINREVVSLKECLKLYCQKYAGVNFSLYHILRSLTYFLDAEKEKDPVLLKPVKWEEIKRHFAELTPRLTDLFLSL